MLTMSEQKQLLNEPVRVISSYQEEEKDSPYVLRVTVHIATYMC